MNKISQIGVIGALALSMHLAMGSGAQAAITFGSGGGDLPYAEGEFSFTGDGTLNNSGNCPGGDPACLNTTNAANNMTFMTRPTDQLFDLVSLDVDFAANANQGQGELRITPFTGAPPVAGTPVTFSGNGFQAINLANVAGFQGVTQIKFESIGNGTVRIDNVVTPLPGALWLLGAGLAGLGVMRARSSKRAGAAA